MTPQVHVLARSHARRVVLKAAFHAPDDRAFECPEEQPKPRGAAVGEATFGGVRRCRFVKRRRRRPQSEVASTRTPHAVAADGVPSCEVAKVPKRRYNGGWKSSEGVGEGPVPKPRSKMSGGEGSGTRLGPTCRASCNPLNGCRLNVT